MAKDLKKMYRKVVSDSFPSNLEITFREGEERQTLIYEKVEWDIQGEKRGLRYGENPDQEAALYRLLNGNLVLGDTKNIAPGKWLCSDMELLQSGKHPGKINITDIDSALNFLRYLNEQPCAAIMKHNNPSGVALGISLEDAYTKAYRADRIASFGGAVALNRSVDNATAEAIASSYVEVVAAPDYEAGSVDILSQRKNLRILHVRDIDKLQNYQKDKVVDYKSLTDGGLILQWSFTPKILEKEDLEPASTEYKGKTYSIDRSPTEEEMQDMRFGWLVEAGVTSNSVIYVKDMVTVGIGTGEQDRVGVAEIARDKAYRKYSEHLSWEQFDKPYSDLSEKDKKIIDECAASAHGGLNGSIMISDAFFPFRDGVDVGIKEGITGVVQPGGALRDHEVIQACNESKITMVFTGQRSFRH
jgi:phosphoribosylaminoimidazolecarboxamide formyltransferase / IMP cyclohydrolase